MNQRHGSLIHICYANPVAHWHAGTMSSWSSLCYWAYYYSIIFFNVSCWRGLFVCRFWGSANKDGWDCGACSNSLATIRIQWLLLIMDHTRLNLMFGKAWLPLEWQLRASWLMSSWLGFIRSLRLFAGTHPSWQPDPPRYALGTRSGFIAGKKGLY